MPLWVLFRPLQRVDPLVSHLFFSIAYSDFVETQADKLIRHDASRDMVAVLNLLDPWFVECMEVQTVVNYGNVYN